ncbi:MAG: hypothetical protein ACYC0C_07000 [Devosia sp.]
MDLLKEFFRDKSRAQLLMLAAIMLLGFSQFFEYMDEPLIGSMVNDSFVPNPYYSGEEQGTGWQLHPHAWVILVVLAFAFLRDEIVSHPLFIRYGWWAAAALVVAASVPGAWVRTLGGGMGGIAVLMALAAALLHLFETKKTAPAKAPPHT